MGQYAAAVGGEVHRTKFDLERFNRGDYTAAAEPETLARTLSRVLYPDDTTYQGKELRLKQEFFLTSAALQDILRRYLAAHNDLRALPKHVAIQMNDTHPAIAGPELIRLLSDEHGMPFDEALTVAGLPGLYQPHPVARGAGEMGDLHLWQCAAAPHADRGADRQLAPPRLSEPAALRGHRQAPGSADGRAGLHHVAQGEWRIRFAFGPGEAEPVPGTEPPASGPDREPDQRRHPPALAADGEQAPVRADHRKHRGRLGGRP
jgi:hypothetical protein